MPTLDYNTGLGTEWLKNATYLGSIPLHPFGEMYLPDFVLEHPDDVLLTRHRLSTIQRQLILNILAGFVFSVNLNLAIKMVKSSWRTLPGWCCLLPSLLGLMLSAIYGLSLFSYFLNCRIMIWFVGLGITMSIVCSSTILLQKAYLVLCRKRWILMVGVFFILPQLTFLAIVIIFCPITLDDISGCVINYPHFLPWYWLGVAAPINAFFSAVFSYIAYRQYRLYGSDAWKRLARDGIQTMCLVVLCNVVCGICIIFKVGGNFSEMFFLADWSLNSTILVQHCSSMRRVKSLSNSKKSAETPKTSQSRKSNTIPTTVDEHHY